eukprot:Skav212046  [mRNA]  locus=scaffold782:307700:319345:- [translate_table: standard]
MPSVASVPRLCSDSAGSLDQSHGGTAVQTGAWPSFRHQFFLSSCGLWVAVCSAIVAWQTTSRAVSAFERMHFEVIRVFAYGLLTCVTTGLGAVPFLVAGALFIRASEALHGAEEEEVLLGPWEGWYQGGYSYPWLRENRHQPTWVGYRSFATRPLKALPWAWPSAGAQARLRAQAAAKGRCHWWPRSK